MTLDPDLLVNYAKAVVTHGLNPDDSTGPTCIVRFKLLGSFDSLDEILQTNPELLL